MLNQERLARLKQRFEFDQWPEASSAERDPQQVDVKYLIPDWRLAGWELDVAEGDPQSVRTLWQAEEGDYKRVLVLDLYDCNTESGAREYLLEQLDQFESPLIERLQGNEQVGDVAFSHPGRYVALFTRGHRVAVLKNAGVEPVPALEIARQVASSLDQLTTGR